MTNSMDAKKNISENIQSIAELAEWKRLTEAATSAKWESHYRGNQIIITNDAIQEKTITSLAYFPYNELQQKANAKFIAASRAAMPRLIAEVERLQEENKSFHRASSSRSFLLSIRAKNQNVGA